MGLGVAPSYPRKVALAASPLLPYSRNMGVVVSVHIARAAAAPAQEVAEVRAVPGLGLEGDRYSGSLGPDRELTLIEIESIEGAVRDYGIALSPGDARRQVVTRGVALNHLVGREFSVGDVRLRGIRLCEPCSHLAGLTHEKVLPALIHRGGLRAQILSEGVIRPGQEVRWQ